MRMPYQFPRLLTAVLLLAITSLTSCGGGGSAVTPPPTPTPTMPAMENHPDLRRRVVYQIVTDRFFDGDTSNDNPAQSAGMYDSTKTNWQDYWGGDLAGIQQKISYLQALGVGAIWISPPVDNVNVLATYSGVSYAPYHGYWARDFKRIEEHFGDANNTWSAFDALVAAAHAAGIQVIVDFAANHTNPISTGEYGVLYDDGVKVTDYATDAMQSGTAAYYHHQAAIADYSDRYQLQYYTLDDLADLSQENPAVDAYLKAAINAFQQHGVDGFRLDAVKHVNWGWEYTLQNAVQSYSTTAGAAMPPYLFGEWMEGIGDTLFADSAKWANNSGITLLDYPLYYDVATAFVTGGSFNTVYSDLTTEAASFAAPNDLATFIDNHDNPRLLSKGATTDQLNEALAFLLTCRGVPIVYYGDEQYLHVDSNGGGDPYTRAQMTSFDSTTTAAVVVRYLAALRSANPAIAYGGMQQRWINNDVFIFERRFNNSVVLVAINKNESNSQSITGLYTALPAGTYADYMNGLLNGSSLTVNSGSGSNPAVDFTLTPHTVAIWQYTSTTTPQAGALTPREGQPGLHVAITGTGFGTTAGTVLLDSTPAAVVSWADDTVVFSIPSINAGSHAVTLKTAAATAASVPASFSLQVQEASLVPVTITLQGEPTLASGEQYYLSGDVVELGAGATDAAHAAGPLLLPPSGSPLITVALPAGVTAHLRFYKLASGSTPTAIESVAHSYTAPTSGTDAISVTWNP